MTATMLVTGCWPRHTVTATWTTSTLALTTGDQAAIAARWAEREAAAAGISLFDGPMGRLETWEADATGLRLTLSRTSYRTFLGTNVDHPDHPRPRRADPLGVSTLVRSADGFLLLGVRSLRVALYPGGIHPFGGGVESTTGDPDPVGDALRELHEEAGVTAADLGAVTCLGIGIDPILAQPELLVLAESHLDAATIAARIDPDEHSAPWQIAAADVPAALHREARLTPIARCILQRSFEFRVSSLATTVDDLAPPNSKLETRNSNL